MDIKWVKLDVSMFSNRKIRQIRTLPEGDSTVVIWLQLLCLAGTVNDGGRVYFTEDIPYTEKMLARALEEPEELVKKALRLFAAYGMIERDGDYITVKNWEKYQAVEALEKAKELNRARQKRWYEANKKTPNVSLTLDLTQPNAIDKEEEIELDTNYPVISNIWDKNEQCECLTKDGTTCLRRASYLIKGKRYCNQHSREILEPTLKEAKKRFTKPSITDIEDYCKEKGILIDSESFFDYYESKGWIVGKAPMKDWKAAVRNWAKNDKNWQKKRKLPDFTDEDLRNDSKDSSITNIRERLFGGSEA